VVDKVRHSLDHRDQLDDSFEHYQFEEARQVFEKEKKLINHQLLHLNQKCFGDYNIINLTARLQKDKETLDFILIDTDLKTIDFEWSYDAFKKIEAIIEEGLMHFGTLPHTDFALNMVFDEHFKSEPIEAPNPFADWQAMENHTTRILDILEEELLDAGNIFNANTPINQIKITVGALYSKKMRRIKASRALIISEWNILTEYILDRIYFHHSFPEIQNLKLFSSLQPGLETLKQKLVRLISEKKHYEQYYNWRKFLIHQPENIRILLTLLSEKVNRKQWQKSFKIFYFNAFIEHYKTKHELKDSLLTELANIEMQTIYLQDSLSGKIKTIWKNRQQSVLNNRTLATVKNLYNYRRNKAYGKINALRKIIHNDFELFSTIFPVVMVNPSVCSSIFPLTKDIFDLVLFDEASQLRIEDTFPALLRGKTKIISGDKHQMPPTSYFNTQVTIFTDDEPQEDAEVTDDYLAASNSLLDFCMDADYSATFLDFHYRSQHPALIQFSNEAFYGGRLVPMPAAKPNIPIDYFQVNGIYDTNRTNWIEAKALVDYVYATFISAEVSDLPSVGIATFNINQRNLIWDLLMEKTYDNELYSKQLELLISRGLFVKNLENIQGDERDVILISTTFGLDESGQFKQQFGPITQQKGYQLLNVIITRAKRNLVVFTSIPELISSQFIPEIMAKGNSGKSIFYAWLHYAKAIAEQQEDKRKNILELVSTYCVEGHYKHQHKYMALFHQIIYTELVEAFGSEAIQHNYSYGGFILELCVLKNLQPVLAISTDYLLQADETAYKMLLYKQGILTHYGIKTYAIETFKWLDNWTLELKKLMTWVKSNA
jgi:hypothetical protein